MRAYTYFQLHKHEIRETEKKHIRIPLEIADDFAELSSTGTNRK